MFFNDGMVMIILMVRVNVLLSFVAWSVLSTVCILSFNLHQRGMRWVLPLFPFHRQENRHRASVTCPRTCDEETGSAGLEHRLGNAVSTAAWRASTNRAQGCDLARSDPEGIPRKAALFLLFVLPFNRAHNGPRGDGLELSERHQWVSSGFQDVVSRMWNHPALCEEQR